MRTLLSCCLALLVIAGTAAWAAEPEVTTDEQKTLYTLGLALSRSLGGFTLSEAELEIVKLGLTDGVLQREPKVDPQLFMPKVQEMQKTRAAAVAAVEHKAGEDFLAKAATGQASDLLTTLYLAFTGPVIMAPAMNTAMWEKQAVQRNVSQLKSDGVQFVEPESGWLSCRQVGAGRMATPEAIVAAIAALLHPQA